MSERNREGDKGRLRNEEGEKESEREREGIWREMEYRSDILRVDINSQVQSTAMNKEPRGTIFGIRYSQKKNFMLVPSSLLD